MDVGYQVGQVVPRESMSLQQQWQDHLGQFRMTRDVGFDIYGWAHHYLIDPFQHFQPFTVLARLAAEAGNMKLATSVLLLPLMNPVDIAEEVATLDHISEGRFILGMGLGFRPEECEATGTKMSERAARFTESLELMKRLWTEDEVTHHGRFFHVTNARPTARPYQRPYPPLWLGGVNDSAIRRIGRTGHVLYIGGVPLSSIRRKVEIYRTALEQHGHPVPERMAILKEFYCASSRSEAIEKARWGFEKKYEAYAAHGLGNTDPEMARIMSGGLETLMNDNFIVGSPQECLEQIARYGELGITDIFLRLFYPGMSQKAVLEHVELVGKELLPEVHRL